MHRRWYPLTNEFLDDFCYLYFAKNFVLLKKIREIFRKPFELFYYYSWFPFAPLFFSLPRFTFWTNAWLDVYKNTVHIKIIRFIFLRFDCRWIYKIINSYEKNAVTKFSFFYFFYNFMHSIVEFCWIDELNFMFRFNFELTVCLCVNPVFFLHLVTQYT